MRGPASRSCAACESCSACVARDIQLSSIDLSHRIRACSARISAWPARASAASGDCAEIFLRVLRNYLTIRPTGCMVEIISEWVRDSCGTSVGFIDYCVFNMLNWFWNVEHELSVMNDLEGKSLPSTRSCCSSFKKRAKLLKMFELAKTSNSRVVTAIQSMQLVYIRKLSCRNAYDCKNTNNRI